MGLTSALDHLTHGVLLVGESGSVLFANRAAEELLRSHDGLVIRDGQLHAEQVNQTTELRTCVASAGYTSLGTGAGGVIMLGRASGKTPLRVLIAPLPRRKITPGGEEAVAVLFLTDPEQMVLPSNDDLRRGFGLTPAQARVALGRLAGDDIERLAVRLCISRETVRMHVKQLFAKTDTQRQSELIRVLLSSHLPMR